MGAPVCVRRNWKAAITNVFTYINMTGTILLKYTKHTEILSGN